MIALLKERDGSFYCSNCRMRVKLQPQCEFCGAVIENFTSMLIKYYDIIFQNEIKEGDINELG